jgi:predicted  nucleic acid-binding Zn-ribbon protein
MLLEIEQLLILQDRDQKIKRLRHDHESLPAEKKKLFDKLAGARTALESVRHRLRENDVERRKLELEVESKRGAISRFRQQQQGTRKNEEYQALAHEIEHAELQIRRVEDQELELMEAVETLQEPIRVAETELKRLESVTAEQIAKLESGAAGVQERLSALEEERARVAANIPEETLDLYQRLFFKKGDLVVVPAEGEVCGGCHMRAPAQTLIRLRGDRELVQCPNCGRILYRPL